MKLFLLWFITLATIFSYKEWEKISYALRGIRTLIISKKATKTYKQNQRRLTKKLRLKLTKKYHI